MGFLAVGLDSGEGGEDLGMSAEIRIRLGTALVYILT